MVFVNEYENDRTIDYETGAYLVYEGMENHPGMERFSFYWNGIKMEFSAHEDTEYDENNKKIRIHRKFFQIDIPHDMQDQRDEIANMIKQALEAHGYLYDKEPYKEVTAEFVPPQNKNKRCVFGQIFINR